MASCAAAGQQDDEDLADWGGDMPEEWQEEEEGDKGDNAKRQPLKCSECGIAVTIASMFLLFEPSSWFGA